MQLLNYILWNPSLEALRLGGFSVRWYSLCWLLGLALAYAIVRWLYKRQGVRLELFEPLFVYCFVGILIGARLGHCLFYEPAYFLSSGKHMVEMLLPIRFMAEGGWRFIGYEGLASHGGTLGLTIALLLYVRRTKLPTLFVLDCIAIATPATACLIRLGNLMNSEIVGKATAVSWAFVFERLDSVPRHPAQLYEALAYALFFIVGMVLCCRGRSKRIGTGFFFGMCLTLIFVFRFFIEYTKDIQEAFEASMPLNMGQLLSLPFVAAGVYFVVRAVKRGPHAVASNGK